MNLSLAKPRQWPTLSFPLMMGGSPENSPCLFLGAIPHFPLQPAAHEFYIHHHFSYAAFERTTHFILQTYRHRLFSRKLKYKGSMGANRVANGQIWMSCPIEESTSNQVGMLGKLGRERECYIIGVARLGQYWCLSLWWATDGRPAPARLARV